MFRTRFSLAALVAALIGVSYLTLDSLTATRAAAPAAANIEAASAISTDRYMEHVRFLASPELEGRGNGTPELEEAAEYLASRFRELGLRPAGENGTYFQTFELTTGTRFGPGSRLTLGTRTLEPVEAFAPFRFSTAAEIEAPLVFAGYGITAPELDWDDYEGIDVRGKIVVLLRHEPEETDPESAWNGTEFTSHATFLSKVTNAKQHGAAGMILINDPLNHENGSDDFQRTARQTETTDSGIAAVFARAEPVLQFFQQAGFDLRAVQQEMDEALEPQPFELSESQGRVVTDVVRVRRPVRNVLAALDGADPATQSEWIVIGAHYDHLGRDASFSLARDSEGEIHHGADDNASGTSGILELARVAAANRESFDRSVLFSAYAGEELGLLGSSHFVNNPTIGDVDNVISMINLDMIGRVRDDRATVIGVGTSPGFRSAIEEMNTPVGLRLDYSNSGRGGSDHMSFMRKGIPVLFFISGLHEDYHRPSDTADKINADGARKVLMVVYQMMAHLAAGDVPPPTYTEVIERRARRDTGAEAGDSGGGGYGAYFGSVPDFRDDVGGVLFADVTAGSPADAAGLRAGDLLVEFNGKAVGNLYDFTYALQAQKPGDTVTVVVRRDGQPVRAEVTLGER